MADKPITYSLKDIDPQLWARVGQRLEQEHRTRRVVVVRLLELYAIAGLDALTEAANQQEARS